MCLRVWEKPETGENLHTDNIHGLYPSPHIIKVILILIYLLTVIGLAPSGSSKVHIYTKTVHRTTKLKTLVGRLAGIRTQSNQTKIKDELTV